MFQRTYNSNRNEDFGLGRGWSYAFNESITLNNDNAVLTTSTGDEFAFRQSDAKSYVLQNSEAADVQEFEKVNGNTISAKSGDINRVYKRVGNTFYLSEVNAPEGLEVSIKRNSKGNITNISSISGEINLIWSNGSNAKLIKVIDNAGRLISFEQSNNSLNSVTTAIGGKWQYEYKGGLLNRAVDPTNNIALNAKYDSSGRTLEFGDAVGINRLSYKVNTDKISTVTTLTDSLDYTRTFRQNEDGITTVVSDKKDTLLNLLYNEANRLLQITDVNGATSSFVYDSEQRLTKRTLPNGEEETFAYNKDGELTATAKNGEQTEIVFGNENGNLTERRIRKDGKNIKSVYNRRGKRIRLEATNGVKIDFEYDEKGRETALTYSDSERIEKTFDAAGRKTLEKTASGFIDSYAYNANNQVIRQSDSNGRSKRIGRDAGGNIIRFTNQNNDSIQIIRDEAGRIVQMKNSNGKSRRYTYDSRGALTEFVGADGRDLAFEYNDRGELQNVVNTKNNSVVYTRNKLDTLAGIQPQGNKEKNAGQIRKISYAPTLTKTAVDDFCAFGDGFYSENDGWDFWGIDNMGFGGGLDGMEAMETDCSSPFFGGNEMFGGGENCSQCKTRERNNCRSAYNSSVRFTAGGVALAGVGCVALTAGTGLIACGILLLAGNAFIVDGHWTTYENCLTNVNSKCEAKCNK